MSDSTKTVPLVIYSNNERIVIGSADVEWQTGEITARVEKPEYTEMFGPKHTDYSIFGNSTTQDILEVAAILKPYLKENRMEDR